MTEILYQIADDDLTRMTARAARRLGDEIRETQILFEIPDRGLFNDCVRDLEKGDFAKDEHVTRFSAVHELVSASLLQEVTGVTTMIEEVFSDAGCIEYAISKSPSLTPKGERLMRLDDALGRFRDLQLELAIRDQDAKIVSMRARN